MSLGLWLGEPACAWGGFCLTRWRGTPAGPAAPCLSAPVSSQQGVHGPAGGLPDSVASANVGITCGTSLRNRSKSQSHQLKGSHRLCVCVRVSRLSQSTHRVHRCGSCSTPARAMQASAAVCLSVSRGTRPRPPLTPLSHRYIGPSTVFAPVASPTTWEQWRCVSSCGVTQAVCEWAARGRRMPQERGPAQPLRLAAPTSRPAPAAPPCSLLPSRAVCLYL